MRNDITRSFTEWDTFANPASARPTGLRSWIRIATPLFVGLSLATLGALLGARAR